MKLTSDQLGLLDLLVKGIVPDAKLDADQAADEAVALIGRMAVSEPRFVIEAIMDAVRVKIDSMLPVALAVLSAKASDSFLGKRSTFNNMVSVLAVYSPAFLCEFIELLRSKELGRGFGARPQKWVRCAIQTWSLEQLEGYGKLFHDDTCTLIRMAHPKFEGKHGDVVKAILQKDKLDKLC